MKRIAVRSVPVFLAFLTLAAQPPQWTAEQVRDAVGPEYLISARLDGTAISLDLNENAASPQALRAIIASVSRLPGDRGRLTLELSINGQRVRPHAAKAAHRSARRARQSEEPQSPVLVLLHDADSAGIATSIRSVLSAEGLEIVTSADLEAGASVSAEPETTLAVQATPGAGAVVVFSSESSREFAESLQSAIPGTLLIECDVCVAEKSITLELGDSAIEPAARIETGLAIRSALKTLAAADRSASKAEVTSPAPGSTLPGASVTFQWSAGAEVTNYWLMLGTWVGGNTIYSSDQGTLTSATVSNIPTDGRTIYVRLWSYINQQWVSNDYQYSAFSAGGVTPIKAALTSPAAGSTLPGASATFQWNTGTGASRYYLFAGSWVGGNTIFSQDMAAATQATISNLPVDGSTIFIRLWSYINNSWEFTDYTFKTAGTPSSTKAAITSPAPGSALPGSSATFQWSAGAGVTRYYLFAGRWTGGNSIFSQDMGTNLSATIANLPSDGSTVYVRLWSYVSGGWQFNDYTYTSAGSAPAPVKGVITSPAPGSTLPGSSATFSWTSGSAVQRFWLFVGTTVGNNDIYGGDQGSSTTATVGGLPSNGKLLFVRLWSYINGAWQYSDAQYKAAGQ